MIGHAKDWVQLCGKKRYKVTSYSCIREWEGIGILSVWSKGGVACRADEVRVQGLQRRGCLPVPVPPLFDKQQSRVQNKYNAQSHDWRLKLDVYALMCETIQFKCGICNWICKFKSPHMNSNLIMLQLPLCDHFSSNRNVYDMPLICSWNVAC